MALHRLVSVMRNSPLGDHSDPVVADVADLMRAGLDVLFAHDIGPALRDAAIVELLDAVDNDGSSLLELVSVRSTQRLGEQHLDPQFLQDQIALSESAFLHLRAWSEVQVQEQDRASLQVAVDVENVSRERLKIAFEGGPVQVAHLLDAILAGGTDDQRMATARLASAMAARSFSLDQVVDGTSWGKAFHELVERFARAVKPPLVVAADDILQHLEKALTQMSTAGSVMFGIANDPPPPDPLAA